MQNATHGRSPFDALATLTYSGQALAPLVKTRGFGMTPTVDFPHSFYYFRAT